MSIGSQKLLVGFLGLTLFASVITVGYMDQKRKKEEAGPALAPKALLDPKLEKGRKLYEKLSCIACHGSDGTRGASNLNAQTNQEVPPVAFVATSFTKEQLKKKILKGVSQSEKLEDDGPIPPLSMPGYEGRINDTEMEDLINYLYSLQPKDKK